MQDFLVPSSNIDTIQPAGSIECISMSICDIASGIENVNFNHDDLFGRVTHDSFGEDPMTVVNEAVKNGLRLLDGTVKKVFVDSTDPTMGGDTYFKNVQENVSEANYPSLIWFPWSPDFNIPANPIMNIPSSSVGSHCGKIEGKQTIDGVEYLVIEALQGFKHFMPESVFEWAIKNGGSRLLLTQNTLYLKKKTIMEKLISLLNPLVSLYQQLIKNNKMNFDTPQQAYHSVRVMADNAGMTVAQKNDLCATIYQESGFIRTAMGKPNANGSKDIGICQFNNPRWIGKGKLFESNQDCLDNPEKAVKTMIQCFKDGHANWWMGYAVRQQWLLPNSPMWKLKTNI